MATPVSAAHAEPPSGATPAPKAAAHEGERSATELVWRWGIPVAVTVVLALLPAPAGLAQNAWNFFALFAGIVAALVLETGLMGIISPYATGAALPYYNSGYISSAAFWRNGTIYGIVFLLALLVIGLPLL